jgi:hypothetical protein
MRSRNARYLAAALAVLVAGVGAFVAYTATHPSSGSSPVAARLAGIPAVIRAGGGPVQFTATLTNRSDVPERNVAPLFQVVGGPCNCAQGSLERFDNATRTWEAAPMPEGDGDPNFLSSAVGGVTLRPGESLTIRYRLTLDTVNPAKSVHAVLYAVRLPAGVQLGLASVTTRIAKG